MPAAKRRFQSLQSGASIAKVLSILPAVTSCVDAAPEAPSLLEQAIADAGLNVEEDGTPIEFSSQFLTQGDIMTALAPVLFARSDTFLVRAGVWY